MPHTGPEIITCYGLPETRREKLRSPAFCGWTKRKLITQFHATHNKYTSAGLGWTVVPRLQEFFIWGRSRIAIQQTWGTTFLAHPCGHNIRYLRYQRSESRCIIVAASKARKEGRQGGIRERRSAWSLERYVGMTGNSSAAIAISVSYKSSQWFHRYVSYIHVKDAYVANLQCDGIHLSICLLPSFSAELVSLTGWHIRMVKTSSWLRFWKLRQLVGRYSS